MTNNDFQADLFGNGDVKIHNNEIVLRDSEIYFQPNFFNKPISDRIFNYLMKEVQWRQDKISMYGREILLPRLSAWYGDNDKSYTYSGITLNPDSWTTELLEMKVLIEEIAHVKFSSVLINRYRDGKDYVGWHTDAEKELGKNPIIASLNFGATRKFQLRRIDNHTEKHEFELKHGTLLIMKGATQHFWQHQVPKTATKISERINLTFRVIQ